MSDPGDRETRSVAGDRQRSGRREWLWLLRIRLRQGVLELPPPGSTWFAAARRALVVAFFFAVGVTTGELSTTVMASFGALQVGLMEGTRPTRSLAALLSLNVLVAASAAFVGSLLGGTWWVVPLVAALGYLYGSVSGLGLGPLTVSLGALALTVIFAGLPQTPSKAATVGLWVGIGGFTQMALWLIDVRRDRARYVRRMLGIKASSLARIARDGVVTDRVIERSFTVTDRAREAVESAGLDEQHMARHLRVLQAESEALRALLTWLELREPGLPARMEVAMCLEHVATALRRGRPVGSASLEVTPEASLGDDPPWLATRELAATLGRLIDSVDAMARSHRGAAASNDPTTDVAATHRASLAPSPSASHDPVLLPRVGPRVPTSLWGDVLSPASVSGRHGLRMALALAVAEALTLLVSLGHSFWLPLTVVFTLRPEVVLTVFRGATRVLGNLAAVVVVPTLLLAAGSSKPATTVLVVVLATVTFKFFTGNYALTSFGLAGTVLVLDTTVSPDGELFVARIVATIAGALLSLAVIVALPLRRRDPASHVVDQVSLAFSQWTALVCRGLGDPRSADATQLFGALTTARSELIRLSAAAEAALFDVRRRREGVLMVAALDAVWRMEISLVALSYYARALKSLGAAGIPVGDWCRETVRAATDPTASVAAPLESDGLPRTSGEPAPGQKVPTTDADRPAVRSSDPEERAVLTEVDRLHAATVDFAEVRRSAGQASWLGMNGSG